MATYSPPTTPTFNPDIREDLLQRLDQEIMATQQCHDEVQRKLKQRRQATSYLPEEFENALHDEEHISPTTATPTVSYQRDYSFNLTGDLIASTSQMETSRTSV